MSVNNFDFYNDLVSDLSGLITKAEKPMKILEIGAKAFTKDLLKLTNPHSRIRKSGYTHLVDSFCYEVAKNEIKVGWKKYYGRMVEEGTRLVNQQPHLKPTFEKNKDKYYTEMINNFFDERR